MLTRRTFLGACTGTIAALGAGPALAALAPEPNRSLAFLNLHTGEKLDITYYEHGKYLSDALDVINHLLRDHRTDEVHPIDPGLLDLLSTLHQRVDGRAAYHVISGYRSPATNAMLSGRSNGVATRSLHLQGRAIDIRLPHCELRDLRQAALALHAGGVGYYPASEFIHVDTGRTRSW